MDAIIRTGNQEWLLIDAKIEAGAIISNYGCIINGYMDTFIDKEPNLFKDGFYTSTATSATVSFFVKDRDILWLTQ